MYFSMWLIMFRWKFCPPSSLQLSRPVPEKKTADYFKKLMDLWEQTQWHNQKITRLFLSSVQYTVLNSVSLATVNGYIFKEKCSEIGHFRVKESN